MNTNGIGGGAAGSNGNGLIESTLETDDIKLYDITPMDYYSKTQTHLSKSQIFRDELWRRRHTQTHGNGGSGSSSTSSTDSVDIESVLTRNMSQDDLKRLIEHQMVEAMKLTRLWTYNKESDSNDEAQAEMEGLKSVLTKSCASLDVSVRQTADFPVKRRRSKSCKISKAKNTRRISL